MKSKTGSYSSNAGDPTPARALSDAQLAELTVRIKRWAEELGFQQTGISDTELGDHESRLQTWLDKKFHGAMGYMWESLINRAYRDARLASIGGGADEVMLSIICKLDGTLPKNKS